MGTGVDNTTGVAQKCKMFLFWILVFYSVLLHNSSQLFYISSECGWGPITIGGDGRSFHENVEPKVCLYFPTNIQALSFTLSC